MPVQFTDGRFHADTDAGAPLAGGRLYTYVSGTTTFKATYTDYTLATPNTYVDDGTGQLYIALNSRGEAAVWMAQDSAYTFVLKTSAGVTVWTSDGEHGRAQTASETSITDAGGFYPTNNVEAALQYVGNFVTKFVDVTASPFNADSTGATSATLAIEAAAATLADGDTLWFPPGGTYLIDYPWTAFSDSDATNLSGRGKAVIYLTDKKRITIHGNNCKIVTTNHPIDTKGGLLFVLAQRCPDMRVTGFRFDMSFTGHNTLSTRYPMCGGVWFNDAITGTGVQTAMCSGAEADNLTFKLYHPEGAFSITSAPYGGDNNNGHKIISVFAAGDGSATAYANQNRTLRMHDIRFLDGHNGYGCWCVAYNDAKFWNINAEAWIGASYTIATTTYTGANYVCPVRFYQYYCDGFEAYNVSVRALPNASRTGAFSGVCGGIHLDSGLTDRTTGKSSIWGCDFTLDATSTTLSSVFDVGISSTASGLVSIKGNTFDAHSQAGVVCVFMGSNDGTGEAHYVVSDNLSSKRINGPFVQIVTGQNTSDAVRTIKSVLVSDNIVRGWGGEGAVYSYKTGVSFYGVENLIVSGNIFDASGSTGPAQAVNAQMRTSADYVTVTDNQIKVASAPISTSSATAILRDNATQSATSNGTVSYLTNNLQQTATFAAAAAVSISGINTGELYEYQYIEHVAGGGNFVTSLAGLANSGTGTIRTVAAGNTGRLTYKKVTTQR